MMTAAEFYKDNIGIYDSPCEMMVAFSRLHVTHSARVIIEETDKYGYDEDRFSDLMKSLIENIK